MSAANNERGHGQRTEYRAPTSLSDASSIKTSTPFVGINPGFAAAREHESKNARSNVFVTWKICNAPTSNSVSASGRYGFSSSFTTGSFRTMDEYSKSPRLWRNFL